MTIEVLDKCEKKDEIAENVMEVCVRLIRHLADVPVETSLFSHVTPDPHDVDLSPENKVLKTVPVEEVTKCLKLVAGLSILRSNEAMAFKTAMSAVADAFDNPLDLKVQIIKSLCGAIDLLQC